MLNDFKLPKASPSSFRCLHLVQLSQCPTSVQKTWPENNNSVLENLFNTNYHSLIVTRLQINQSEKSE